MQRHGANIGGIWCGKREYITTMEFYGNCSNVMFHLFKHRSSQSVRKPVVQGLGNSSPRLQEQNRFIISSWFDMSGSPET